MRVSLSDATLRAIADRVGAEDLPGDLPEVADFIGVHAALLLAARIGCGPVYLQQWTDATDQWSQETRRFVDVIGVENTKAISRLFGGNWINIPKCEALFIKHRNQMICESGKSSAELAREHGRHRRHIKRIRNAQRDDRQGDLF